MLLRTSSTRLLIALGVGVLLWLPLTFVFDVNRLLLLVIANQSGFFLTSLLSETTESESSTTISRVLLAGVLFMVLAVLLGVVYDVLLRLLFAPGTPTIGPWGAVRHMDYLPAAAIVLWAVLIGPAGDERFFRGGLFASWHAAGRPWCGAILSSALFALARLDPWNGLAYFGLGMLLCGAYRCTESVWSVWLTHALLNAAMFVFLFCGYE